MNPQDDPEARIRALEPTELGIEHTSPESLGHAAAPPAQPWYATPPAAPPNGGQSPYGADPYTAGYAPHRPSGPSRPGLRPWMAILPIAVVLLLAGGAAALLVWLTTSAPTGPGSSGRGDVPPSAPTITVPTDIAVPPPDTDPEQDGSLTISGIGVSRSVECHDTIVLVSGANNTVDITGKCTAVTVSGFDNHITAESSVVISVSGFDNTITYRTGNPRVNTSGSGNTVTRG